MTETVAPVTVQTRKPAVISPPLVGPNWLDANSCCDMTRTPDGAQPDQRASCGPPNGSRSTTSSCRRTAAVHRRHRPNPRATRTSAPTSTRWPTAPSSRSSTACPSRCPAKSPTGLPLDAVRRQPHRAGHRRRQLRALRPPQDRQRQGQAGRSTERRAGDRARSGNTGNSDAPHLHFHVMSTPDPLRSDGLPFVFKSFRLDGRIASTDADRRRRSRPARPAAARLHRRATKPMSAHWFSM